MNQKKSLASQSNPRVSSAHRAKVESRTQV